MGVDEIEIGRERGKEKGEGGIGGDFELHV